MAEKEKHIDNVIVDGVHTYSQEELYVVPPSPIKEKLEEFRDMKLGFMVHFGLYQQLGIIASWGMDDASSHWSRATEKYGYKPDWQKDGAKFREEYFGLIDSFNPVRINTDDWADLAKETGFKYLIFTTKHHDGFCLWDTKQTDYKVTSERCPFSKHEKADIVKNVFDSFRKKGLAIGAYFSKPDWHNDDYWERDVISKDGSTNRMTTYDVNEKPEKWQSFVDYTHNQFEELVRDYGKVDILWLDGGQVTIRDGLDIKLGEAVEKLRKINPELIVVDRTAGGEFENYVTPEQAIPDTVLSVPWESCLTIGVDFNYTYDDDYKTSSQLISLLLEIVCKGGNLALNVSPQPDGRMPRLAIESLRGMGEWLNKYGEAIYKTRPVAPYKKDDVYYTQNKEAIYVIFKDAKTESVVCEEKISRIELLNDNSNVAFTQNGSVISFKEKNSTEEEYFVLKLYKA